MAMHLGSQSQRLVQNCLWTLRNLSDTATKCVSYFIMLQSVTCLATGASLTADPGVARSIPARLHTFAEIDHKIISTVILLSSAESFKKDRCQFQAKYVHEVLINCLIKLVVR